MKDTERKENGKTLPQRYLEWISNIGQGIEKVIIISS